MASWLVPNENGECQLPDRRAAPAPSHHTEPTQARGCSPQLGRRQAAQHGRWRTRSPGLGRQRWTPKAGVWGQTRLSAGPCGGPGGTPRLWAWLLCSGVGTQSRGLRPHTARQADGQQLGHRRGRGQNEPLEVRMRVLLGLEAPSEGAGVRAPRLHGLPRGLDLLFLAPTWILP